MNINTSQNLKRSLYAFIASVLVTITLFGATSTQAQVTCDYSIPASDTTALINAMDSANLTIDTSETICLTDSTYAFTTIQNTLDGANALPVIISPVTIEGNGATFHRDSTDAFRFFNVHPEGSLTLRSITLSNGKGNGTNFTSVIYNEGILAIEDSFVVLSDGNAITSIIATLTIHNTQFTNSISGRGLYLQGGTVTVTSSLFDGHPSGAIRSTARLNISDSVFTNNRASEGGAIHSSSSSGSLSVGGSRFENNRAVNRGGAIFTSRRVSVSNSIFAYNSLENGNLDGSAIFDDYWSQYSSVTNSCFVGNSPTREVRALSDYIDAPNNWWGTVDGPFLIGGYLGINITEQSGNGDTIPYYDDHSPFLTEPPMPDCPTLQLEGMDQTHQIETDTTLPITLSTYGGLPPFTHNIISSPAHGVLSGTVPNLTYTPNGGYSGLDTFTFSTTDMDGASINATITIFVSIEPIPTILVDSTAQEVPFVTNGNCTLGEALHAANTNQPVDNCAGGSRFGLDVIGLQAGTYGVSQAYVTTGWGPSAFPVIDGPTYIQGNNATITRTGSTNYRFFETLEWADFTINDLTLSNGQMLLSGQTFGAIFGYGNLTIIDSTITNNQGGGIYSRQHIFVHNSTFSNNTSDLRSPLDGNVVNVYNSTFEDNLMTNVFGRGGAINAVRAHIFDSQFLNNRGGEGGAVAVRSQDPISTIDGSLFDGNSSISYGGTFYVSDGHLEVTNSIISNNSGGGSVAITIDNAGSQRYSFISISNSCISGNSGTLFDYRVQVPTLTNNWWGSYDGASGFYPGHGDPMPQSISIYPFLDTPPFPNCPVVTPITTNQTVNVVYETPAGITLGAEGSLPPYTFEISSPPQHGTLSSISGNLVTYTPDDGYVGGDNFVYSVTDLAGGFNTGIITLNIDTDLVANTRYVHVGFEMPRDFVLLASGGTQPYVFDNVSTPAYGAITGTPPDLTYTPEAGFAGNDIITFDVTDANGFVSTGTMTLRVANDLIVNDRYLYVTQGVPLNITASVSGGLQAFFFSNTEPSNGVLTGNGPNYQYTVNNGFSGLDSFTITVLDTNGDSSTGTIYLSPAQQLVANSFSQEIPFETSFLVPLGATGGAQPYTYTIMGQPSHGVLSGEVPNVIYTPNDDYIGDDYFFYRVTDAYNYTTLGYISLSVGEPLVTADIALTTDYREAVNFTMYIDGGTQPFTYDISSPTGGVVTGTMPSLTYTPNNNFGGQDTFTVTITDVGNNSVVSTITVDVGVPLATDDVTVNVNYETATEIAIPVQNGLPPYSHDTSTPANGVITGTAPNLIYTPNNSFSGSDAFDVTITDDFGNVVVSHVNVSVSAPIIIAEGDVAGLIAAINTANYNGIPDTIILSGTYTFTTEDNNASNGRNALPIIYADITFRGTNNTVFIRDETAPSFRFMQITAGDEVTIQSITFMNGVGSSTSSNGGAILSNGDLIIDNSHFVNNRAGTTSNGGSGGAIFGSSSSRLDISNSTFEGNSAHANGGAIQASSVRISNTQFLNNTIYELGGAIYISTTSSSLPSSTIIDSLFDGNQTLSTFSNSVGGAIFLSANSLNLTIEDSQFINNSSIWATLSLSDNATIIGSLFDQNTSNSVGAISVSNAVVNISDSIFTNNTSTYGPGAIYMTGNSALVTVSNSCIVGNTAPAMRNNTINRTLNARNNWWGAEDGPQYDDGTPLGTGEVVQAHTYLNVTPFLSTPPFVDCPVFSPVVDTDPLYFLEDTTLNFALPVHGGLPPYSYSDLIVPAYGTLTGTAPNFTYTPDTGYTGADSFNITVTDDAGNVVVGTINLLVQPLLTSTDQNLIAEAYTPLDLTLYSTSGLPPYTYEFLGQPSGATVIGIAANLTFLPDFEFSGNTSFDVQVRDSTGATAISTINVTVNPAPAATITVDTTVIEQPMITNGNCSINEAISAANQNIPFDNCPAGSATETDIIQLPAGVFTLTNTTTVNVTFGGNTVLRGAGMDETIFDQLSNAYTRYLSVSGQNPVIVGMTFRNGYHGSEGGALYLWSSADATVYDVRFQNNRVNSRGGAIYVHTGGRLSIYNSAFHNNSSGTGGAVYGYQEAVISIFNSAFKNNDAISGDSFASFTEESRINFSCVLDPERDALYGDMNYQYNYYDGDLVEERPDICNLVDAPEFTIADGDVNGLVEAIEYANAYPYDIVNETVHIYLADNGTYNFTQPYGGVAFGPSANLLPVISVPMIIYGNDATFIKPPDDEARFFEITSNGNLRLDDTTLTNGYSSERGGAVLVTFGGDFYVNESHFINNRTSSASSAHGGAIHNDGASIVINSSNFVGNSSGVGGAIYNLNAYYDITNSIFLQNSADVTGSSVATEGTEIWLGDIVSNCFTANTGISVYNGTASPLDYQNNWWGAASGPSGEGMGTGDTISTEIDYVPFLTSIPNYQVGNCYAPLVPGIQTVDLTSFEASVDIVVVADGGVPSYTFSNVTTPANGTVSGTAPNLMYTVNAGFIGTDSFTVDVTDGSNATVTNTIYVNVTGTTIVVDSFNQEVPFVTNDNCTLGEAIVAANTDTAIDACLAGNGRDLIELPNGTFTLTEVYVADTNGTNGFPIITSDIVINGNGAIITRNDQQGTPEFRFFKIAENSALELFNLTLNNGSLYSQVSSTDYGGAIFAIGGLTLDTVTLTNNRAYYSGGAVVINFTESLVRDSLFENNSSANGGGLVMCSGSLVNTIIQNNTAIRGGGIRLCGAYVTITDSTIVNNIASTSGGQISNIGDYVTITDSLIAYDLVGQSMGSGTLIFIENGAYATTINESCLLYEGSGVGVQVQGTALNASNNWWGSSTGPSQVGLGYGTRISQYVDYDPFYTASINGCPIFAPTANDQIRYTPYETALNIPSIVVVDGVPPYSYAVGDAQNGIVTGTAPDSLVYTPNNGFSDTDYFDVVVTDQNNDSDTARITIHIAPLLQVVNQQQNTTYETPVTFALQGNGGRSPYVFSNLSAPTNGVWTGTVPNITYTPNDGFTGIDTFTFDYTDANGSASTGTVTITVTGIVVANNQTINTFQNTAVGVVLTASNGTQPYTYANFSDPPHGFIVQTSGTAQGYITYVPDTGYVGADSFTFQVTDNNANTSTGTVTVNISTNVVNIPDGNVSAFISAVTAANASGVPTAINLAPDSTYNLSDSDQFPVITSDMVIYGNGSTMQRTSGTHAVFSVGNGGQLTLDRLTLSGGLTALQNNGGTVLVTRSTLIGMTADGIENTSGVLTVLNSTISGNSGGGIENGASAVANITSATIAGNGTNGGLTNTGGGSLTITNSILDGNTPQNCSGTIDSNGGNISSDNSCNLSGTGDQNNTNPMLQPLIYNGGPTSTQALLPGSPAIDNARGLACDVTDQRGAQRLSNNCDIGAFEVAIVPMANLAISQSHAPNVVLPNTALTYTLTITNNGAITATNVFLTDTLPTDVTFDSASATTGTGCVLTNDEVLCNLGNLNNGQSSTVSIHVTVNGNATELVNNATVLAIEDDPNLTNNSTSASINLIDPLDIVQIAPQGTITDGIGAPEFQWTHPSAIEQYVLWVGNVAGTRTISETISASTYCGNGLCSITLTNINASYWLGNDNYTWWLQPIDGGVAGTWIGPMSFSINLPVPTLPVITDVTGEDTHYPTFHWTLNGDVTYATSFNVWTGQVGGGVVVNTNVSRADACGTNDGTTCSFQATNAHANANFTLYLQAVGAGGMGGWTTPYGFTVNAPVLGQITGLNISGSLTTPPVQPTYSWNHDATAEWYQVQVNRGATMVFSTWYQVGVDITCTSTCTINPATALANGDHTWWVAGWNSVDGMGQWSAGATFTVAMPAPLTPTGLATSGSLVTPPVQPTYIWTHDPNTSWYQLYVSNASGVVLQTWYEVGVGITCTSTCSIQPTTTLSNGNYNWWVQGWNSVSTSAWSATANFTVNAPAPTVPSGLNTSGSLTTPPVQPTYTWTHDPNTSWYQLYMSNTSGVIIQTWYEVGVGITCASTCSIAPSVTLANGNYNWWVQGWNAVGTSAWSATASFTVNVPAPLRPTGLNTSGTQNQPMYSWNHDPNTTWYQIQVNGPTGVVIQTWYEVGVSITCTSTCSLTPATILTNGGYTWWVQGYNTLGNGAWSDGASFNVTP